jgi:hypothetical protein
MPLPNPIAPTWDTLIANARSGPGSDARREVGAWAMERVRAALGETWPRRWYARFGSLPAFVSDPASNAIAYAHLVETGLRLEGLTGTLRLRRLCKEWSRHAQRRESPEGRSSHRVGAGPVIMRCPACDKRYTCSDDGIVEVRAQGDSPPD